MRKILAHSFIAIVGCALCVLEASAQGTDDDLKTKTFEAIRFRAFGSSQVVEGISRSFQIPIGFEMAEGDLNNGELNFEFKGGNLKALLDVAVNTLSRGTMKYRWNLEDGCVVVSPASPNVFTGPILNARIGLLEISGPVNSNEIVKRLAETDEMKSLLSTEGIQLEPEIPGGLILSHFEDVFRLTAVNATARSILNRAIAESSIVHTWIARAEGRKVRISLLMDAFSERRLSNTPTLYRIKRFSVPQIRLHTITLTSLIPYPGSNNSGVMDEVSSIFDLRLDEGRGTPALPVQSV